MQAEKLVVFKAEIDEICALLERPVDSAFHDASSDLTEARIQAFERYAELMRGELDKHKKLSIARIKECADLLEVRLYNRT